MEVHSRKGRYLRLNFFLNIILQHKKGNEEIRELLDVSNDIAFRLSNVSKQAEVPLICEYSFANVTISSSYWNGTQGNISNCNSKNASFHLASIRFPNRKEDGEIGNMASYIELPKDIGKTPFKSAGVFIAASDLIQLLLPGSNNRQVLTSITFISSINVFKKQISERSDYKAVNSPIISYTLYNPNATSFAEEAPLPNDSYVQLVFRHEVNAKYPSFRTLRRDKDYEGEESTVMDSSICSFLVQNETTDSNSTWMWDNKGCRVISMNSTHTVCKCTHLTAFADLMGFHQFVVSQSKIKIVFWTHFKINNIFTGKISCTRCYKHDVHCIIDNWFVCNAFHPPYI